MFENDNHLIIRALNMWANYIETGEVCCSASDAVKMGQHEKVNALTSDQMKLILKLRKLSRKFLETNPTK